MNLIEDFQKEPWSRKLEARRRGFMAILKHLEKAPDDSYIIETGTIRIVDNWAGDGQSTRIWDWVAERKPLKVISIDIMPEQIETAKSLTKNVQFIESDSVKALADMHNDVLEKTTLLYLDSFDWSRELNLESSYHHMMELTAVWRHLPSGCMIAVDDRHDKMLGKHWMVEAFMTHLDIEPAYKGYQIAWVKP